MFICLNMTPATWLAMMKLWCDEVVFDIGRAAVDDRVVLSNNFFRACTLLTVTQICRDSRNKLTRSEHGYGHSLTCYHSRTGAHTYSYIRREHWHTDSHKSCALTQAHTHARTHALIHPLTRSFIHPLTRSFIHSFTHTRTHRRTRTHKTFTSAVSFKLFHDPVWYHVVPSQRFWTPIVHQSVVSTTFHLPRKAYICYYLLIIYYDLFTIIFISVYSCMTLVCKSSINYSLLISLHTFYVP